MDIRNCPDGLPEAIANAALVIENLPGFKAPWADIVRFALTFDGYAIHGSSEVCALIANERRHETLTDLRTCLFFEQRRWHHFGEEPDLESMRYIHGIVENIRSHVRGQERID